jgi:hypothetical protein
MKNVIYLLALFIIFLQIINNRLFAQFTCQANTNNPAICTGVCNGSATAYGVDGIPPYSYLWNPTNQTTQTATGLCSGVYNVTVFDSIGWCDVTVVIPSIMSPSLNCTLTNDSSNSCIGTVSFFAESGSPPFTYFWQGDTTTQLYFDSLCAGVYTIEVEDTNDCVDSTVITISNVSGINSELQITNYDFTIYPNPTTVTATLELPVNETGKYSLQVFDISGRMVLKEKNITGKSHTLDLSGCPEGLYFVRFITERGVQVEKVVKQ